MRAVGIIPARFGSTRFPGKALADLLGKPVIQWVYEGCLKAKTLDQLLVATDDDRIYRAVEGFAGKAVMTSSAHASGTDRVAEVAKGLEADIVVNIQGDEPFIEGALIDELTGPFLNDPGLNMATVSGRFTEEEDVSDPNIVKVVCDLEGNALHFSRYPIPFRRNATEVRVLKHIGIYALRREFLLRFAEWEPTPLERTEGLEQLRALEHGERIKVVRTDYNPLGIDTPEDLERARAVISGQ